MQKNAIALSLNRSITIAVSDFQEFSGKPFSDYPEYYYYNPRQFVFTDNNKVYVKFGTHDIYLIDLQDGSHKKVCSYGADPGEMLDFNPLLIGTATGLLNVSGLHSKTMLYNNSGKLKKSYYIIDYKSLSYIILSKENCFKYNWIEGIYSYHPNQEENLIFPVSPEQIRFFEKYDEWLYLRNLYFIFTEDDHILIGTTNSHVIWEYSFDGELIHKYDDIPSHYTSYSRVENWGKKEGMDLASERDAYLTWLKSWSFSQHLCNLTDEVFVVSRRLNDELYIDFYSNRTKKYFGYYKMENSFLAGAENGCLYIGKCTSPGKIILDEYNVGIRDLKIPQVGKKNDLDILINYGVIEKFDNQIETMKYLGKYDSIEIEDAKEPMVFIDKNGEEYNLGDKLDQEKDFHFIILTRNPNDGKCQFTSIVNSALKICKLNSTVDVSVVYSNPNPMELKDSDMYNQHKSIDVFYNSEPRYCGRYYSKGLSPKYPWSTILLTDNNKQILNSFEYTGNFHSSLAEYFDCCVHIMKRHQ